MINNFWVCHSCGSKHNSKTDDDYWIIMCDRDPAGYYFIENKCFDDACMKDVRKCPSCFEWYDDDERCPGCGALNIPVDVCVIDPMPCEGKKE